MTPPTFRDRVDTTRYRVDAFANLRLETERTRSGLTYLLEWIQRAPSINGVDPLFDGERVRTEDMAYAVRDTVGQLDLRAQRDQQDHGDVVEQSNRVLDEIAESLAKNDEITASQDGSLQEVERVLEQAIVATLHRSAETADAVGLFDQDLAAILDHPDLAMALYQELAENPEAADAAIAIGFMPHAGHRIAIVATAADDPAAARYSTIRGDGPQTLSDMAVKWNATRHHQDTLSEQTARLQHLLALYGRLHQAAGNPSSVTAPPAPATYDLPSPGDFITDLGDADVDDKTLSRMIAAAYVNVATQEREFATRTRTMEYAIVLTREVITYLARENEVVGSLLRQGLLGRGTTEPRPGEFRLSDEERWALVTDSDMAMYPLRTALDIPPHVRHAELALEPGRHAAITAREVEPHRVRETTHPARPTTDRLLAAYAHAEADAQLGCSMLWKTLVDNASQLPAQGLQVGREGDRLLHALAPLAHDTNSPPTHSPHG